MILFLGDSFTWGQGIYFEELLKDGSNINLNINPENISYKQDIYRKNFHFPALVSKHFNKSYSCIWGNGGSNYNIINILENLENQFYSGIANSIEYFVIQFTCPSRDHNSKKILSFENQISKVDSIVKSYDKMWYGLSWRPEFGEIIQENYNNNLVPITYNNVTYNNFEDVLSNDKDNLTLNSKYGIDDFHFSKEGHDLIAKSIIRKIENNNIY